MTSSSRARHLGNWLFRNRTTGEITIAQRPNLQLWGFLLAELALLALPLTTRSRQVVGGVSACLLAWWSIDEIVRGVNPWRRLLGAVVTVGVAGVVVSRLH